MYRQGTPGVPRWWYRARVVLPPYTAQGTHPGYTTVTDVPVRVTVHDQVRAWKRVIWPDARRRSGWSRWNNILEPEV